MQRVNKTIAGPAEKAFLQWLCRHMPAWVTSDMLTLVGIVGAFLSFFGYWLSGHGSGWLWLALVGVVIHYLGDSLDGTLARHLKAERPRYGFFLDHMSDTLAIGLIAVGMGLSPYAHLTSGLAVLAAYYTMVILTMATALVTGVFRISFNGLGPTEIQLLIALGTIAAILLPTHSFAWHGLSLTVYDLVLLGTTFGLLLTGLGETIKTLRALALIDPPHPHSSEATTPRQGPAPAHRNQPALIAPGARFMAKQEQQPDSLAKAVDSLNGTPAANGTANGAALANGIHSLNGSQNANGQNLNGQALNGQSLNGQGLNGKHPAPEHPRLNNNPFNS